MEDDEYGLLPLLRPRRHCLFSDGELVVRCVGPYRLAMGMASRGPISEELVHCFWVYARGISRGFPQEAGWNVSPWGYLADCKSRFLQVVSQRGCPQVACKLGCLQAAYELYCPQVVCTLGYPQETCKPGCLAGHKPMHQPSYRTSDLGWQEEDGELPSLGQSVGGRQVVCMLHEGGMRAARRQEARKQVPPGSAWWWSGDYIRPHRV